MLRSRNRLLRYFLFESIYRSGYDGSLISRDGSVIFVHDSHDRGPGRELFIRGTQDFAKLEIALQLVRASGIPAVSRILDIGANIGTICIPAVKRGLIRSAIGVEAVPAIERLFRANILLNDLEAAIVSIHAAVGAIAGDTIDIAINTGNQGDNRIGSASGRSGFGETIRVKTTTIDALLADHSEKTLIWMDIQGYEGIALTGAPRTLVDTPPLVLEFCPALMAEANSYHALKDAIAGYRGFHDLTHPGDLRPLSDLDRLHTALGMRGNFTDILVL